jgi:hypothetical protein
MLSNALETLMDIEDRMMPDCLPSDDAEISALENRMIKAIQESGIAGEVTKADLDALTDFNYHTIRRATEKAIQTA